LKRGEIRLRDLRIKYPDNIGLYAKVKGEGYRADGAYEYNSINALKNTNGYQANFYEHIQGIITGNKKYEDGRYVYGQNVYTPSIDIMKDILKKCNSLGITVIGIMLPYAPYIYKEIKARKNKYGYMAKTYPELKQLFDKYGDELYDYTDGSLISYDSMYMDGYHGYPIVYHNILSDIKSKSSVLSPFIK
jgi:hypothetical protein